MQELKCTVKHTSYYTLLSLYRSYFKIISVYIELQVYRVACCSPYVHKTALSLVRNCHIYLDDIKHLVIGTVLIDLRRFFIHTYIPLTLYPQRGSIDISDIPPRRFTKIT
jgi:hypothetical protein